MGGTRGDDAEPPREYNSLGGFYISGPVPGRRSIFQAWVSRTIPTYANRNLDQNPGIQNPTGKQKQTTIG